MYLKRKGLRRKSRQIKVWYSIWHATAVDLVKMVINGGAVVEIFELVWN